MGSATFDAGQTLLEYLPDEGVPKPITRHARRVDIDQSHRGSLVQQTRRGHLIVPATTATRSSSITSAVVSAETTAAVTNDAHA